jgi:DeoR family transcriptional regulator, fructose operon transcriptional repressor
MLPYERQTRMVELIQQWTSVSVKELSDFFQVSEMTIRRDLEVLESKGLVSRIHGGATGPNSPVALREDERQEVNIIQKAAIAEVALRYVEDGQTIFIDAGTTTAGFANLLTNRKSLTIVTNSVKVLSILADSTGINLIGTGGSVYGGAWSFVGSMAEAAIRRFNSDITFLGITSLSLDHGLTEINYFEADTKSNIIKQSQKVILLADSSKFEKVSAMSVAKLEDIDVIITDDRLSKTYIESYQRAGPELILAPTFLENTPLNPNNNSALHQKS